MTRSRTGSFSRISSAALAVFPAVACALWLLGGSAPAFAQSVPFAGAMDVVSGYSTKNGGLVVLGVALPSGAVTDTVTSLNDDGSAGTLRSVMAAAASGDTIVFSVTGTIILNQGYLEISQNLTISGPGAASLAISGNNATGVFLVDSGATATISGVTIENGFASSGGLAGSGGGIFNSGTLTLTNSTLSGNSANTYGGGIYNPGVLTVSNSTLSGNSETAWGYGGCGILNTGVLTVLNSTLVNNICVEAGGAILNASTGTLTVVNSNLSGNYAGAGGGIFNSGTLTLTNSTLSGNSAQSYGGGLENYYQGASFVTNSTLAGNSAGSGYYGGNIANVYYNPTLTLKNTLLASGGGGNCYDTGTINSDGYNLSDDSSCSAFLTVAGDLNSTLAGLNPAGLQNNGGPTQTIALLSTGSAMDAISLSNCTDASGNLVTTDQRGITRPQGSGCDIGAFELAQVPSANVCPAGQTTPPPCSYTITLQYKIKPGTTFGANPVKVVTQGAPNLDFTLASTTCTGSPTSCNVQVAFAPLAPGLRMGAVQLSDSSGNPVASNLIYGIGQGPAIALGPGTQVTVPASGLNGAYGVAVDAAGDVFIADTNNNRVVEVPAGGGPQTTVGSGLSQPFGVAVDGAGDVFIADASNNRVVEVPAGGGAQTTVGSGLSNPSGVAVDGAGDVFIADTNNRRVVKVPAGGGAQTIVSNELGFPEGVAVDGAGDVFIADTRNNFVLEVPVGGAVGTGLDSPSGVAVDGAGDIFIADTGNNRVVEVQRSQPPTLSFASTAVGGTSSDSPQSVTIQNIGNQPLNAIIPGLVVGGPNFLQVAGSGTPADCTSSFALTPGATCNLSISFEPQSVGPLTSTAAFTDNALNASPSASQSIALQGTGTQVNQAPAITSGNNTTFVVGTMGSFTVTTTGSPAPTVSESGALPIGVTFTPNGNGTGTLSGTPSAGGTFSITFTASNGVGSPALQNFTLTVNKATTTTGLTSSPNPSAVNQSVIFTATVTGPGTPTGTVRFRTGTTTLGTRTLSGGVATLSVTFTTAGTKLVTATYSGDANFIRSTSPALHQVVNKTSTSTGVTSNLSPSSFNQPVTFTAAVSSSIGNPPNGETVTFKSGAATLGTGTLSGGTATLTTSSLAVGGHNITAGYAGDTNFAGSTSAALSQEVNKAVTTTALVSSLNPSNLGQPVTFTATINGQFGGTPTRTVIFKDGTNTLSTVTVSGGMASYSTSSLTHGLHHITANYGGDINFNASTATLAQTVH